MFVTIRGKELYHAANGIRAATTLAEQLREAIEGLQLEDDRGNPIEVRLSIGVAQLTALTPEDAEPIPQLIAAADRCLYRAKNSGRNRVEADPTGDPQSLVTA